ncbi:MAG: hypothetical protein U1E65_19440 [Myxococcota bacterium]
MQALRFCAILFASIAPALAALGDEVDPLAPPPKQPVPAEEVQPQVTIPEKAGPQRVERRLQTLDHLMTNFQADRSRFRLWGGLGTAVVGAGLAPPAIVLVNQRLTVGSGVMLGASIGAVAGGLLLAALSLDPMEQIAASYLERKKSGISGQQLVELTEAEWKKVAEESASKRVGLGAVVVGLSVVAVGAGAVVALIQPGNELSTDRDLRVAMGSAVSLVGVAGVISGFRAIFFQPEEEESWEIYRESSF